MSEHLGSSTCRSGFKPLYEKSISSLTFFMSLILQPNLITTILAYAIIFYLYNTCELCSLYLNALPSYVTVDILPWSEV